MLEWKECQPLSPNPVLKVCLPFLGCDSLCLYFLACKMGMCQPLSCLPYWLLLLLLLSHFSRVR